MGSLISNFSQYFLYEVFMQIRQLSRRPVFIGEGMMFHCISLHLLDFASLNDIVSCVYLLLS